MMVDAIRAESDFIGQGLAAKPGACIKQLRHCRRMVFGGFCFCQNIRMPASGWVARYIKQILNRECEAFERTP